MSPIRMGFLLVCLIAHLGAGSAAAQSAAPPVTTEEPTSRATLRFGPLAVTPTFNLAHIGFDSNVLQEETGGQRDFTFTAIPGARTWMRLGDARLAGHTTVDWVYFAQSTGQRAWNLGQTFALDVPLASVTPRLSGEYVNSRQRPNGEFDAFVRRHVSGMTGGTRVRLSPLTSIDVEFGRTRWEFDDVEVDGVRLDDALDRQTSTFTVALREEITPLTTLVVRADRISSAFRAAKIRDAGAWSVMGGFEFQPLALLSGSALIGVQRFTPVDASVRRFAGLVADVDLRYLVRESTSAGLKLDRRVEFSYWENETYYVSTLWSVELRQAVAADWDVVGRFGRERLAYEHLAIDGDARRDHRLTVGAGVGYWLQINGRIGLDLVYGGRDSSVPGHAFRAFRLGGSFAYGF